VALIILARQDICHKVFEGSCLSNHSKLESFQGSWDGIISLVSYSLRIRSSPPI
jgi:hypothetical protein